MNQKRRKKGFSLIEVNIAIFVMAVGVLGMVALYPLGLRESAQGQADLKQSMFADYVLNQLVAAASQSTVTWSQWTQVKEAEAFPDVTDSQDLYIPTFLTSGLNIPGDWKSDMKGHYKIACCLVPGASDRIMGIMVQSTELVDMYDSYNQWTNNTIYYAEVMFQGNN